MTSTVFFDPVTPKPYGSGSLLDEPMAGTESTVVRVADALGAVVMQHNRVEVEGRYIPPGPRPGTERLIVLREPHVILQLHQQFPEAHIYLWCHDTVMPGSTRARRLASSAATLAELDVTVVCVSDYLRLQVESALRLADTSRRIRTRTLFNPVDDDLAPDGTRVDPSKLVFLSSPHKGLAFALDAFRALRRAIPELHLSVADPGYRPTRPSEIAGVEWLGSVPHPRAVDEMRSALCVFAPNFVRPETFGLVLAEANAVGTPVLTHDCGSAAEVLGDPRQLLPVTRWERAHEHITRRLPTSAHRRVAAAADRLGVFDPYIRRIAEWRSGDRPIVGPDPRFRLSVVTNEWRQLLSNP
jgi:glycosyltransferase involved in cell wall biosynthesis